METFDSQINIRLSASTLDLLKTIRIQTMEFETFMFQGDVYPTPLLGKSDSSFARFLIEKALRNLELDYENEYVLNKIVDLLSSKHSIDDVVSRINAEFELNPLVTKTLIAIGYKKYQQKINSYLSRSDSYSRVSLNRLTTSYGISDEDVENIY